MTDATSKPTWGALKDALEKMVAFSPGDGWHVSREAADKAMEWITWAETHQPNPVPKLLPEEDEDVSLVWRTVDGWAILRTFPKDDEPYWLAMPSANPAALASSPEVAALIREAEARVWDHAAQIGGDAAVEVLLRHEPDAGPLKIQMTRQAIANPIRRAAKGDPT